MSDIKERLKEACNGHPNAVIPWPHRLLHDAIDAVWEGEKRIAELEAELTKGLPADCIIVPLVAWNNMCTQELCFEQRIAELEKELKDMDNLCKQQAQNLTAEIEKNELLEKVAEAAERQYPNLSRYTERALRAAGYLKEQGDE